MLRSLSVRREREERGRCGGLCAPIVVSGSERWSESELLFRLSERCWPYIASSRAEKL